MAYFKLTARAHHGLSPLADREACVELWAGLRRRIAPVLACVLMPNHLHLDFEGDDPAPVRAAVARELGSFAQRRGRRIWEPVPRPEIIQDRKHLMRHIRYVHLNPCRARLAKDPLEWEWSTHRDGVGAVMDPWTDLPRWIELWRCRSRELPAVVHAYVSGDPTVAVEGSPLPPRVPATQLVSELDLIVGAVLHANRASVGDLRRPGAPAKRMSLLIARELGGRSQGDLAKWLGISKRTLRDFLAGPLTSQERAEMDLVFWILANRERFGMGGFPKAAN